MRQMPSVTEITVPCVRDSGDTARLSILFFISSLISEGLQIYLVNAVRIASSLPRTVASRTWSPTAIITPPINSGSTFS